MLTLFYYWLRFDMSSVLIILVIIGYFKWRFNFWKSKNIPHLAPSIPLGNLNVSAFKISLHEFLKVAYDTMKDKGFKHFGYYAFLKPVYVVIHPEYVKAVLTKDFAHFYDRGLYHNERDDPLSTNLLTLEGERWKRLRVKFLSPFSPSKIKMMFDNMLSCANAMLRVIEQSSQNVIDTKEISACFTTDIIGSCVFGIDCSSFDENASEFRKVGRKLFERSFWFRWKMTVSTLLMSLANMLRITAIGEEVTAFFRNFVATTMKYREENGIVRKDFLELLMELRRNHEEGLSIDEATAQSFLFFSAGFETTSTAITFGIYELAQRQDIQNKLREEIREILARSNGTFTYENIMEMKYLDQVIKEILRMHPSVPTIPRICTKKYKLPDGKGEIEEGTYMFVPVFALHRDPEYYPDPDVFDPDRFSDENKAKRHQYAYLPFGEGPRICIGKKFGLLQVKIGLASLLNSYSFKLNHTSKNCLRYDKNSMFLRSANPIWVDVEKINNLGFPCTSSK